MAERERKGPRGADQPAQAKDDPLCRPNTAAGAAGQKVISQLLEEPREAPYQQGTDRDRGWAYARRHPINAIEIGKYGEENDTNISSDAVRFSRLVGLQDTSYMGTQINAMRHTLWQAAIAAQLGADVAKEVGDLHEDHKDILSTVNDVTRAIFWSEWDTDEYVDQSNNAVGRAIGQLHPGATMWTLAAAVLDHYHDVGLYEQQEQPDGSIRVVLTKLSGEQHARAKAALGGLDKDGFRDPSRRPGASAVVNALTAQRKKPG